MIRLDAVGAVKVYFYYDFIFNNSLSVYWWRQCLVGQPKVTAVSEATVCDIFVARITKYCWLIWLFSFVFGNFFVFFAFFSMEKVNLDFKIWCKKVTTHGVDFRSKDQLALTALSRCEGCKWPWVKIPGVVLVFDNRLSKSVWSNSELKNRFGRFCLADVRKRTLEVSVPNFFDSVLKERTFFYNSVTAVVVSLLLWLWCLLFFLKLKKVQPTTLNKVKFVQTHT